MPGPGAFFSLGVDAARRIGAELSKIRKRRGESLEALGRIVGPFDDIARWYVEPDCQTSNPADHEENTQAPTTTPIFSVISQFLGGTPSPRPGARSLLVLGDAGTGKTSLLIILYLMHINKMWPRKYHCQLYKLGEDTIETISKIQAPTSTILLLDSLDEDPKAWGSSLERFREILQVTETFYRIIITCRTQYLPEHERDPLRRDGWMKIDNFLCPTIYLSPFSDRQVNQYLNRRFPRRPFRWLPLLKHRRRTEADRIVPLMSSMRFRPMLLAHIEDFMNSTRPFTSEYEMYEQLIEAWLQREVLKARRLGRNHISTDLLRVAVTVLALHAQEHTLRAFSEEVIHTLGARINEVYQIKDLDYTLTGRSLLNVSEEGYRFAHRSIQEFLVAQGCVFHGRIIRNYNPEFAPRMTNLLKNFFIQAVMARKSRSESGDAIYAACLDLSGAAFPDCDFAYANLSRANMENVDLSRANLEQANLTDTNLTRTSLLRANLSATIMRGANLTEADLREAKLNGADFSMTKLEGVKLRRAVMSDAKLPDSSFPSVDFSEMELDGADLTRADLNNARLVIANLKGANLTCANLCKADLSGANLARADATNAVLQSADLTGADLRGAILTGANLKDAKVTDASYSSQTLFPDGYEVSGRMTLH